MPVSSPSYFPPNSSTDQITGINAGKLATGAPHFLAGQSAGNSSTVALIAVGHLSADAGITDAKLAGTIVMGNNTLQALTQASVLFPAAGRALIVIGDSTLQAQLRGDSSVIIGDAIATSNANQGLSQSVVIGNAIGTSMTNAGIQSSVFIGYGIAPNTVNFNQSSDVIIGAGACTNNVDDMVSNVFIGAGVIPNGGATNNLSDNVVIGAGADSLGSSNVVLGFGALSKGLNGSDIVIGQSAQGGLPTASDLGGSIIIGSGAKGPTSGTTSAGGNIIIGHFAGVSIPASTGNTLVIEQNVGGGGSQKALVFGVLTSGNILFGNSIDGTNRDFGGVPGTNMVKLLNGTAATGANVTNGGYFYVLAGVLHWVDSSGNDTTLSVPAAPTTGASTASFVATNKPGSTTGAGPVAWENRVIDGVSYQSPLWAT